MLKVKTSVMVSLGNDFLSILCTNIQHPEKANYKQGVYALINAASSGILGGIKKHLELESAIGNSEWKTAEVFKNVTQERFTKIMLDAIVKQKGAMIKFLNKDYFGSDINASHGE